MTPTTTRIAAAGAAVVLASVLAAIVAGAPSALHASALTLACTGVALTLLAVTLVLPRAAVAGVFALGSAAALTRYNKPFATSPSIVLVAAGLLVVSELAMLSCDLAIPSAAPRSSVAALGRIAVAAAVGLAASGAVTLAILLPVTDDLAVVAVGSGAAVAVIGVIAGLTARAATERRTNVADQPVASAPGTSGRASG